MSGREIAIIAFFLFLVIIQASFAPHLDLPGQWSDWLNMVDIAVAVIALFEKRKHRASWIAALSGGIFLDIYSEFFGFWILILLALVALIKFVLKKYVRIPSFW